MKGKHASQRQSQSKKAQEEAFDPLRFEADTSVQALVIKLRHHQAAMRVARVERARQARARAVPWLAGAVFVVLAAWSAWGFGADAPPEDGFRQFWHSSGLGLIGAMALSLLALLVGSVGWRALRDTSGLTFEAIGRFGEVIKLIERLEPDLHRRGRLWLRVDLRPPQDGEPRRSAVSPYSGALKKWYRKDWLRLSFALADGTMVLVRMTRKLKTKGGGTLRDEPQLRIAVHPAQREMAAAGAPRGFGLKAGEYRQRPMLCLSALTDRPGSIAEGLSGLYASLGAEQRAG